MSITGNMRSGQQAPITSGHGMHKDTEVMSGHGMHENIQVMSGHGMHEGTQVMSEIKTDHIKL